MFVKTIAPIIRAMTFIAIKVTSIFGDSVTNTHEHEDRDVNKNEFFHFNIRVSIS